jgi:hypothetical protein
MGQGLLGDAFRVRKWSGASDLGKKLTEPVSALRRRMKKIDRTCRFNLGLFRSTSPEKTK